MIARLAAAGLCALAVASGATLTAPAASAAPCADVEVLWARGTAEPGGPVGFTGLAFVEALRLRTQGRSLRVRAVRYAASDNFGNPAKIVETINDGVKTSQADIQHIARACPRSRIVFGGYSQGAVVSGYALVDHLQIPRKYQEYAALAPRPLPTFVTPHLAAVVFFGAPSARFIRDTGAPPITIGARFVPKVASYCAPGDTICNGAPIGQPSIQHALYPFNGMTFAAADFAARRL
ncbi:MAG TPA: cutinase family protein [Gordonia sp. (in: high G+C Gram-positive bacteria)]|uniref:cutinase family protein n=1 Tax=unclassified Gordonia (in: high G+C Gram-positive bacteria) TaxID=2657482 RepID=UPI000FB90456|nr:MULTISPECIES: cutinase family protein [unclassified Gordonia (in: high G+C Gram-positive bacteria)]RUP36779.1 MAG: cutinase family protein [Gordonia sp. (in: high G+C Gram-positive bacteria)]HNP56973.1 cutinase family protein [Gordonia sp. (in: high G+C Gram-positive bacteria)]HRC50417.1 cutinase family protein [Gordonia sp. (in: high G+C Gram-positive bacteria)]